jgi:putative lipoprotein
MIRLIACIIFTVLVTFSCGSEQEEKHDEMIDNYSEKTPVSAVYRGYAVFGHEVREFRPCGQDDVLWAINPGGLIWDLCKDLTSDLEPYQKVFAVIEGRRVPAPDEGFGADYPGAVLIESVLYAGVEGPGCNYGWDEFRFRASGNEPFWNTKISKRGIVLSRLGSEKRSWRNITAERTSGGVRFIANDPGTDPVTLTITKKPCRDSMSGSYYAYSAELQADGEELHGCALRGSVTEAP